MKRRWPILICAAVLLGGAALVGCGLFPLAKAWAAQLLLEAAWQKVLTGHDPAAPWPWADFRPVAALALPERGYRVIVVTGASGSSLAFAPGLLDGTARPGEQGNSVIFGHRDTHFAVLEFISAGEKIVVTDARGTKTYYRVFETRVIRKDDRWILRPCRESRLTLITCHPFGPAGPDSERFVVLAEAIP